MALITDPDLLNQGVEVVINTTGRTIQLLKAGNLSDDGVTIQAVYSFFKEEWQSDANLIKYPFPMQSITSEQFEFFNGWQLEDINTSNLFRNGGYAVKNADGTSAEEYIGFITLGEIGSNDQVYYQQEPSGTATNVVLTGAVNQCVQVYADGQNNFGLNNETAFDNRGYFNCYVREWGKTYAQAEQSGIGVSTFTYQAYRFPLANGADLKITSTEADALARTITLTYGAIVRSISGVNYDFDKLIDSNSTYTAEQIYEWVQAQLRRDVDIDAGLSGVTGKTAAELLTFVGDTLVTSTGVWIDDFTSVDTNRIEFYDVTDTKRVFPYVSAGIITFNNNLVSDGNGIYRMFYTNGFGTDAAVLVKDNSDNAIIGDIVSSSVAFDYDYDGDTEGGGAGIDKPITVVGIGLDSAQYVLATGTITRSSANSISLVSALERNYSNE